MESRTCPTCGGHALFEFAERVLKCKHCGGLVELLPEPTGGSARGEMCFCGQRAQGWCVNCNAALCPFHLVVALANPEAFEGGMHDLGKLAGWQHWAEEVGWRTAGPMNMALCNDCRWDAGDRAKAVADAHAWPSDPLDRAIEMARLGLADEVNATFNLASLVNAWLAKAAAERIATQRYLVAFKEARLTHQRDYREGWGVFPYNYSSSEAFACLTTDGKIMAARREPTYHSEVTGLEVQIGPSVFAEFAAWRLTGEVMSHKFTDQAVQDRHPWVTYDAFPARHAALAQWGFAG